MFSKFQQRKNRLDSERPEERLLAIAALDTEKADKFEEQLQRCATSDTDLRVRRAALAWVDETVLMALLDDPDVAETAAVRLVELGKAPDHPVASKVLMRSATREDALALMDRTLDPSLTAELFCAAPEAYREHLLPGICRTGEVGLAALEKQSRGRDKNCNRLARDELDRLRKLVKDVEDERRRAEQLAEALGKITAAGPRQRLEHFKRELEASIGRLESSARQMPNYGLSAPDVQDFTALVNSAEAAMAVTVEEPTATPDPAYAAMIAEFERLDSALPQISAIDAFRSLEAQHSRLTERWRSAADQEPPPQDQQAIFERVCRRYAELSGAIARRERVDTTPVAVPNLDALPDDPSAVQALWVEQRNLIKLHKATLSASQDLRWPEWAPGLSIAAQLQDRAATLTAAIEGVDKHRANLQAAFATAVSAIASCIEDGQLQPALSALGQARRLEKSLPDKAAAEQRKALMREAARIEELKDWQNFATSPKREPMIQALQALIESPLEPKHQADKIKTLRAEWNALGPTTRREDRALANRFNELAEAAFEPCRTYFSDQAAARKQNLAERRRICSQLEQYVSSVDWATTDMQAAEQIMRAARQEWREHHPVDRNRGKTLEREFESLQGQIHDRVKQAWEHNVELKRAIVAEAEQLATGTADTNTKVAEAKTLQRRWREVGATPRKPDQQLWRQFRGHCDAIFAARDVDNEQAHQAIESAIAAAENICETLEAALNGMTPSSADKAQLSRLRGELNALRLPERRERALHKRFDDLARSYNQLLAQQEVEAAVAEINQLKTWDRDMSYAELADTPMETPAPIFEGREKREEAPVDELARLTVQVEILAGIESPEQDRQLRLEVQVAALNATMGQRGVVKEPMELVATWCRLSPKPSACDELRERFFHAVTELIR